MKGMKIILIKVELLRNMTVMRVTSDECYVVSMSQTNSRTNLDA